MCSWKINFQFLSNIGRNIAPSIRLETEIHFLRTQRNLIKSNRNPIVFAISRLIWIQTDSVRLDPIQSENGKYNLINKIPKKDLSVCIFSLSQLFNFNKEKFPTAAQNLKIKLAQPYILHTQKKHSPNLSK